MPASASLTSLKANYDKLSAAWRKQDLKTCGQILDELKLSLTQIAFLPTEQADQHNQELILARDILEIGANYSIAQKDVDSFERYMAQLKTYYTDYARALPESAYKYELLGLNLLCLLSKNKIADFHTALEQLPADALQNNPYISSPVRMEQFIMEGSYNKVIMMKDNVPAQSYSFFVDQLLHTIRDEIASCMEKAYEQISLKECLRMLQLDASGQSFVKERGWVVDGQMVKFQSSTAMGGGGSDGKQELELPTDELAKMAITYAREMEQIV